MKAILKMIKMKEKEFIILLKNPLKVIDMRVILKITKMEKEYTILIMVIDMKEILKMIK